jgi:hypothetical protein
MRAVLATLVAAVALAACAAGAQASIVLSSNGPFNDPDAVTVSGASGGLPAGTTHVSVAQCNSTSNPADVGKRCNVSTAVAFAPAATYTSTGVSLTLNQSFTDFNFQTNSFPSPATFTSCLGSGIDDEQCGVEVSYYRFVMGVPDHLGVDSDSYSGTDGWVTFN